MCCKTDHEQNQQTNATAGHFSFEYPAHHQQPQKDKIRQPMYSAWNPGGINPDYMQN